MEQREKMLFVFNPHAGKGLIQKNLCDIINMFTAGGYDVLAYPTQAQGDGYEKIVSVGKDFDIIVCSGGDGTLSESVGAVMKLRESDKELKIPLGYIPAGSTNDFANSLGISKKMLQAAFGIIEGETFDCDMGQFNDDYFVYVAGFGAFTDVSYETSQTMKNRFGHAAYIAEALKRLPKISGQTVTVEHDGETITGNFILGLVSNSRSIGGMKKLISKDVSFDDGLFEVVLAKTPKNALELNSLIGNAAKNKLTDKNFVTFKASNIVFKSENEIPWTRDGEAGGVHKEVTIKNHQQAIRFILTSDKVDTEHQSAPLNEDSGQPDYIIEDQEDIET